MKHIEDYYKDLEENGFTWEYNGDVHYAYKYGEKVVLFWSDFTDNLIDYCERMTKLDRIDYKKVERYAYSLFHYGIKKTYKKAYKESLRWHKKELQGLIEPLPCGFIDEKILKMYQRENKIKRILK